MIPHKPELSPYNPDTWPKWAQTEFRLLFWSQYALRLSSALLHGTVANAEPQPGWFNQLQDRVYQRVVRHTQE